MARYIRLPEKGCAIFVGDTHGDYQASRLILGNYLGKKDHFIVMLGDYIDRGKDSRKNIDFLLKMKEENDNLFLLAGNHEMNRIRECSPSDFWSSLPEAERDSYCEKFSTLPLAAVGNGFLALHGALPDVSRIEEIEDIKDGDKNWNRIIWGDFRDRRGSLLGSFLGRPKFGRDYFESVMERLKLNVLVRGHDPLAPERMFGNRCLTIFTSAAYVKDRKGDRKIALCELGKEVRDIDDMEIINLDKPVI